ncbi:MAG: transporter substrate-binding domain-containing protein [Phycisphaerales bacterium]
MPIFRLHRRPLARSTARSTARRPRHASAFAGILTLGAGVAAIMLANAPAGAASPAMSQVSGAAPSPAGSSVSAADDPAASGPSWTVATKQAAPFAVQSEDGQWSGMAIELWQAMADELGVRFTFQDAGDVSGVIDAVAAGQADIGVGAITINADRHERVAFTHAFAPAELGIATRVQGDASLLGVVRRVVSKRFLQAVATLVVMIGIVGIVMWLLERRRNAEQFHPDPIRGIGDGFWWSGVTMTTVGYGDRAPATAIGRLVALVWMFASIVVISGLTGAIASALTVDRLRPQVEGPGDLPRAVVGTLDGSAAGALLRDRGIASIAFATTAEGLDALEDGQLDAFVNDAVVLQAEVAERPGGSILVLGDTFGRGSLAFTMNWSDDRMRDVNRVLLDAIDEGVLDRLWRRYVGDD